MKTKLLVIVSISILLFMIIIPNVYATNIGGVTVQPDISGNSAATKVTNVGNSILGIIQVVGSLIAVGMLSYLGIKYIMASPDDKASIKHSAIIYIVGAIVLFTAVNLVSIIYDFATTAVE